MVMCFDFYPEAGSWLLSECLSYLFDQKKFFCKLPIGNKFNWEDYNKLQVGVREALHRYFHSLQMATFLH